VKSRDTQMDFSSGIISPAQTSTNVSRRILSLIRTASIWISVNRDVLPRAEALTNLDQGQMPLAAVKQTIATNGRAGRILDAHMGGEFSPPRHANAFKRWQARMDQPVRVDEVARLARNADIKRQLLSVIQAASRTC
jgi:hypothetical protein